MRRWKKVFHANANQKKTGVAILISDKIDFKIKTVIRDKEGHCVMMKGSVHQEELVTTYVPKRGTPKHMKQTLTDLKGKIYSNTKLVGDFDTLL